MSSTATQLPRRKQHEFHAHSNLIDQQRATQTAHKLCLCTGAGMLLLAGVCWLLEYLFGWQTGLTPLALVGLWYLGLSLKYVLTGLWQRLRGGKPDASSRPGYLAQDDQHFHSAEQAPLGNRFHCGALPLQAAIPPQTLRLTAQTFSGSRQSSRRIFPGL